MLRNSAINIVLKVGLAISGLVFSIFSFVSAGIALEFYPEFIPNLIGELPTLIIGSIISLAMSIWLFIPRNKFACVFSSTILLFIGLISNITSIGYLSVVWPLFIISSSLTIRYYPRMRIVVPHRNGEQIHIVPVEPEQKDNSALE